MKIECGERALLKAISIPGSGSDRDSSAWGCNVHHRVTKQLKPVGGGHLCRALMVFPLGSGSHTHYWSPQKLPGELTHTSPLCFP